MKVIRAEVLGMCFGVRDALEVIGEVEHPDLVTIHGELVHNEAILADLDTRGFHRLSESGRMGAVPETPEVLITAHGISDVERNRLESAGKRLRDTTCPLVTRVHKAARALRDSGYHVIVIGKRNHVEIRGIVEDLDSFDVVQDATEVETYPHSRLGVISQTTATARNVASVREAIERANPLAEIKFVDTVCQPTKDHQRALERLIDQVEAMVVVGGRHSNNTRELAATCRERGLPAIHIQDVDDLDPSWFAPFDVIGLTAGTSTPDETIEAVYRALQELKVGAEVG